MPRKLIISGLALVAAASAVGGATFAKFSDTEVSAKQSIKAGTLDDTSWLQPTMEVVYCDSKQPWVSLAGDQQRFAKMPG